MMASSSFSLIISLFVKSIEKSPVFIIAVPNAKKNNLELINDVFYVHVKAKAENNKANEAIEIYLTKLIGKEVKVSRGKTQKKKTIKLV